MNPRSNDDQLLKERNLRKGKHAYEDFIEAINKTKLVGYLSIFCGVLWLLSSLLLNGDSLFNSIASLVTGATVLVLLKLVKAEQRSIMILIIISYLLLILFEYLGIGIPDQLIPNFGETENYKVVNILTIANDLSPIIYYGIRVAMTSYFLFAIYQSGKVKDLDKSVKNELGIKEL